MLAEYAAFEMGGGPWYGYLYGVIPVVVEGALVFNPIPGAPTYPTSPGNHIATGSSRFPSLPDEQFATHTLKTCLGTSGLLSNPIMHERKFKGGSRDTKWILGNLRPTPFPYLSRSAPVGSQLHFEKCLEEE